MPRALLLKKSLPAVVVGTSSAAGGRGREEGGVVICRRTVALLVKCICCLCYSSLGCEVQRKRGNFDIKYSGWDIGIWIPQIKLTLVIHVDNPCHGVWEAFRCGYMEAFVKLVSNQFYSHVFSGRVSTHRLLSKTIASFRSSSAPHIKHKTNAGTPGGVKYFGKLEEHCFWGNEVKLYEHHVDKLFAMFWHKKPNIEYYVCTINKTFAKPGQHMVVRRSWIVDLEEERSTWISVLRMVGDVVKCRVRGGSDLEKSTST